MGKAPQPDLSMLLIIGPQRVRSERALGSILAQTILDRIEVLVLDCAAAELPPIPGCEHPAVRVLPFSVEDGGGMIRAEAVRQARAPIVCFMEDHTTIAPDYAQAVVAAHQGPHAAISGEVHPGNPGVGISDLVELVNFAAWMPPAQAGVRTLIAANNVSYKRDVLLAYGDRLQALFRAEIALLWQLQEDGYTLYLEPAMKYWHWNEHQLRTIAQGIFFANRALGRSQTDIQEWSPVQRFAAVALFPIRVITRTIRGIRLVQTLHPHRLKSFLMHLPMVLIFHTMSVLALALGILLGPGDSDRQFLIYEINAPRDPEDAPWVRA